MKKISKNTKSNPRPKRKPKKIQRKKEKLWGLEPRTFPKAAQEFIDIDEKYKQDLKNDPKAAEFLSKFHEEVYGNKFKKGQGARNLHKKDERKGIYDGTNARNRDMYAKRYRYQDVEYMAGLEAADTTDPTDSIIEFMYKKKRIESFLDKCTNNGMTDKEAEALASWTFDLE